MWVIKISKKKESMQARLSTPPLPGCEKREMCLKLIVKLPPNQLKLQHRVHRAFSKMRYLSWSSDQKQKNLNMI